MERNSAFYKSRGLWSLRAVCWMTETGLHSQLFYLSRNGLFRNTRSMGTPCEAEHRGSIIGLPHSLYAAKI